jgi:hypothetical protein
MEIYRGSADRTVKLAFPFPALDNQIDVEVLDGDTVVHTPSTVTYSDGVYSFNLPFSLVQSDRELEVHWQFVYTEDGQNYEHDERTTLNVITPILPFDEITNILGEEFDEKEAADVEKAVRYVIQAHTGQFFGKYVGKISVTGSGEPFLRLPRKLLSFSSINGSAHWNAAVALRGSGWYLRSKSVAFPPPIRADWDGWNEYTAGIMGYSGRVPIVAPYSKGLNNFQNNFEYEIDGVWGWNEVPAAVREAAKLLINDYACSDSLYRDRFVSSISAADWRIQFNDGAFASTGNVRANQLLAEYVLHRGWTVV